MSTTHNMGGRSVQWRKKEWRRISSSSCSLSIFPSFFFLDGFLYRILSQQNWTIGRCYTVHFCTHRLSSSLLLLLLLLLFNFVFIDCFLTYFLPLPKSRSKGVSLCIHTHAGIQTQKKTTRQWPPSLSLIYLH